MSKQKRKKCSEAQLQMPKLTNCACFFWCASPTLLRKGVGRMFAVCMPWTMRAQRRLRARSGCNPQKHPRGRRARGVVPRNARGRLTRSWSSVRWMGVCGCALLICVWNLFGMPWTAHHLMTPSLGKRGSSSTTRGMRMCTRVLSGTCWLDRRLDGAITL